MAKRQFNHLTNFGHLFPAATDVIVANEFGFIFVGTLDGFSLIEERRLRGNDTVFRRVNIDNLKLNSLEASTDDEGVTLLDWAVAVLEIRDQVGLRDVARETLNRVVKR